MLLIAVCLFASAYSVLGMGVHYRDGQVCHLCNEEVVPYKQTYTRDEVGKRVVGNQVVYRTEERIISRPSSSDTYVVNRADSYSNRNIFSFFLFFITLIYLLTLSFNIFCTYFEQKIYQSNDIMKYVIISIK